MSSVAPAVEPAATARTSGLAAIFEHIDRQQDASVARLYARVTGTALPGEPKPGGLKPGGLEPGD